MKEVKIMKKLFIVCSLIAALTGVMAFNAVADQINGALSISGTSVTDNIDLSLATAFNAFSNVVVSGTGGEGDYAPVLAGQPVTYTPFTFSPALTPNPLVPLWAFSIGSTTYSFDATGLTISDRTPNTIAMHGTGIAYITGFDPTPGNWYLSANRGLQTASFSASSSASAVPEPATMFLLGMGLVGIGTISRRKSKQS